MCQCPFDDAYADDRGGVSCDCGIQYPVDDVAVSDLPWGFHMEELPDIPDDEFAMYEEAE